MHVVVQGRKTVGIAVEHVELVRELVDDQVVAFPPAAGQYARPGKNHRPLVPGFAAVLAVPLVLHAAGIAVALGTEEVVGVEDDFVEALVPVEFAQVQQRQLGLRREKQALLVVEIDARQGGEMLVGQEQHAGLTQPAVFVFAQAVEHRQALAHGLPALGVDRVARQGALAPPCAQ